MMNRFSFFALLLAFGCTAKDDSTAKEDISLKQTADSVSTARVDGTETVTGPPIDIKKDLPVDLEKTLTQTHRQWQLPTLTEFDAQRIPAQEQGPYFVQADFNGDQQIDYAVQIIERDSATVLALVKDGEKEGWKEFVLQRTPLLEIEDKKRSLYYLSQARKESQYYDYGTKKKFSIKNDGVSVGAENYTATYVFENGQFKKYETGD